MQNVYWFKEINKDKVNIAGGKGAQLGEMTQAGFPIPPGFCVSAQSYFAFVKANKLDAIIALNTRDLDYEDTLALNRASESIKKAILSSRMPDDIRADVVRAYNKLCGADLIPSIEQEVFVAVRSSATAEDLPEASFAGQQATFLNVKGGEKVVDAVKACWASLFEARAIYYRNENHFDHLRVGICAIVQKMIQSEKSGVMFTANAFTSDTSQIVIEAGFGLGEAIVSGMITPDHYVVSKNGFKILEKQVNTQKQMIVKAVQGDQQLEVPTDLQRAQKLSDNEIVALAQIGAEIEAHYGAPQDIEWAIDEDGLFIVQSRNVTTLKKIVFQQPPAQPTDVSQQASEQAPSSFELFSQPSATSETSSPDGAPFALTKVVPEGEQKELVHGLGAAPGQAVGVARVILDLKDLYQLKKGEILVTTMTTPDFVSAMKRAAAIVTDEGGSTCHAAIVSRELGIPCVVGTQGATAILKTGQLITVDANVGSVYEGKTIEDKPVAQKQSGPMALTVPLESKVVTGTKIYVNLGEPDSADAISKKDVDGVGLLRAEFMMAEFGKHPRYLLKEGRQQEFIDHMAKGLRKFCSAFQGRPVIYRASDFRTNEFRNLEGGAEFEPHEENPMIGFRGCFRYVKDPQVFNLELEAIKIVREKYGLKNLWLMIPFVRTIHDFKHVKQIVEESGLHNSRDFKLGIMCEVPSTVILAEEFCQAGAQFFSIGSNDLTQLTLGVDRDSPVVAEDFDERDESILASIKRVIESCHKYNVPVGICGQAPSVYPEFAEKLVEFGIDSISVNPDVIDKTRGIVASAEQRVLLKKARKQ